MKKYIYIAFFMFFCMTSLFSFYEGQGTFKRVETINELWTPGYYVFAQENSSNVMGQFLNDNTTGENYLKREVFNKNSEGHFENPPENVVWFIERIISGGYTIFSEVENVFIGFNPPTTTANYAHPTVTPSDTNTQWRITLESNDLFSILNLATEQLTPLGTHNRYLRYDSTLDSERFFTSTNDQNHENILLYKLDDPQEIFEGSFAKINSVSDLTTGYYIITSAISTLINYTTPGIYLLGDLRPSNTDTVFNSGSRFHTDHQVEILNDPNKRNVFYIEATSDGNYTIKKHGYNLYLNKASAIFSVNYSDDPTLTSSRWNIVSNSGSDASLNRFNLQNVQYTTRYLKFRSSNAPTIFNDTTINQSNSTSITLFRYEPPQIYEKLDASMPITPGSYLIVAGDTHAMRASIASSWFQVESVSSINNSIINSNPYIVWELEENSGNWTLYNAHNNVYVSFTGTNTSSLNLVSTVSNTNNREKFTITWHDGQNAHHIQNEEFEVESIKRILAAGQTISSGFRNYRSDTTTENRPVLYKLKDNQVTVPQITDVTQITAPPEIDIPITIQATITDATYASLVYNIDDNPHSVLMTSSGNVYTGVIPANDIEDGTKIELHILAHYGVDLYVSSPEQRFFTGITPISTMRTRTGNPPGDLTYGGYIFKVHGVSLMNDRIITAGSNQFFIQDDTAGINIFRNNTVLNLGDIEGRIIEVTGALGFFNEQLQINANPANNGNITVLGLGTIPSPIINTAAFFNNTDNRETYSGMFIGINTVSKDSGIWPNTNTGNIIITDDTDEINLRILEESDAIGASNEPAWPVSITGILGYHSSVGNQIILRGLKDIHLLSTDIPEITNITEILEPPYNNQDLTISATVSYSGNALGNVYLRYTLNDEALQSIQMTSNADIYTASIPYTEFTDGTRIVFYVEVIYQINQSETSPIQRVITGITPIETIRMRNGNTLEHLLYRDYVFRVQGVSLIDGSIMSGTRHEFYIQDGTAGIFIFCNTLTPNITIEEGNNYEIIGKLGFLDGELLIDVENGSILDNGAGTLPNPVLNSIEYFNMQANMEKYAGSLVSLSNVSLLDGTWPSAIETSAVDVTLSDGTDEVILRLLPGTGVYGNEPEWSLNLVGILGFSKGVNRVFIRSDADFSVPFTITILEAVFGEVRLETSVVKEVFLIDNTDINNPIQIELYFSEVTTEYSFEVEGDAADFEDLGDNKYTIYGGKSIRVVVTFHPTTEGEKNVQLNVRQIVD